MMKKVAILTAEGYEKSELDSPRAALEEAGYKVEILSPVDGPIKSWNDGNWGDAIEVNHNVNKIKINAKDYEALVIPGGVINPDQLRRCKNSMRLIQDFDQAKIPIAAICHGPQALIEADVVKDRKMTSFSSIQKDLENAGARWVDEEVVQDGNLITSRSPDDLKAFNEKIITSIKS